MATAAGAAVAAARRRVIEHFMAANAIDPKSAIAFEPFSFVQRRIFDSFIRANVLRPAGEDSWYLDLPSYIGDRKARKKRAATIMGVVAALGAAAATIGILS